MGWSCLLLPQPVGRNSSPRGFSSHFFPAHLLVSSFLQLLACLDAVPCCAGFLVRRGFGVWQPRFSLAGGVVGQDPRGRGCQQSVGELRLRSGATGSCCKSGMREAGAARAGGIPRSFGAARLARSHAELENERSPSGSPRPPAPVLAPGSSWSPRSPRASLPQSPVAPGQRGSGCTAVWSRALGCFGPGIIPVERCAGGDAAGLGRTPSDRVPIAPVIPALPSPAVTWGADACGAAAPGTEEAVAVGCPGRVLSWGEAGFLSPMPCAVGQLSGCFGTGPAVPRAGQPLA